MAAARSTLVLLAAFALSGCGDIVAESYNKWEAMRSEMHERRLRNDAEMRAQMAAGAFGRDQLLPRGNIRSAASFGLPPKFPFNQTVMRLPSLADIPVASLTTPAGVFEMRRADSATGGGMAGSGGGGSPCVYKPVMTADDIAACR